MQLYLFTGEESYLSQQELRKRKTSFVSKYGETGLFDVYLDDIDQYPGTIDQIQNALMSGGMFASKKLVILRGIPLDTISHNKAKAATMTRVQKLIEHALQIDQGDDTILICQSYKPDKRTKEFKRYSTHATVKTFPTVSSKEQWAYLLQRTNNLLSPSQTDLVISILNADLRALHHESKKIIAYANHHQLHKLNDEQLLSIISWPWSYDVFAFLDCLYTDSSSALSHIDQVKTNTQDIFQFLGALYWGVKISLHIINLHTHQIKDGKTIANLIKVHPFAVQKQLKTVSILLQKKQKIYNLYHDLLDIDLQIKTGVLPVEWFRTGFKQAIYRFSGENTR